MLTKLLSHAHHNVVAFIALFVALSRSAIAASSFIKSTDTIPAGDLAGTSYTPLRRAELGPCPP